MPSPYAAAREVLAAYPTAGLLVQPSPIQELTDLRTALGGGPRLLMKRDDLITFAFGGNKVRKLDFVAAEAVAAGADVLITCGGVQSNHMRVTAATAARLGLGAVLVANGPRPDRATGNALLDEILGAEVRYVGSRAERTPAMHAAWHQLAAAGHRAYMIPLGASTPLGALGFAAAVAELSAQDCTPDVIVHATSSGGTQAGLLAGCELFDVPAHIVGISADDPAEALASQVRSLITGVGDLLGVDGAALADARSVAVDDGFVGEGYGVPTEASREATTLLARTEGIFLDPTYTAKAMAGALARIRRGEWREDETVLFWHTGGLPGLFA